MSIEDFKARLNANREQWVELRDGRAILFHKPSITTECVVRDKSIGAETLTLGLFVSSAKDWRGFSTADVLPGSVPEDLPFSIEYLEALMEQADWRKDLTEAFLKFWEARKERLENATKN